MPPDVKTRGRLAMIAAYGTVGIPTLAVLGVFLELYRLPT